MNYASNCTRPPKNSLYERLFYIYFVLPIIILLLNTNYCHGYIVVGSTMRNTNRRSKTDSKKALISQKELSRNFQSTAFELSSSNNEETLLETRNSQNEACIIRFRGRMAYDGTGFRGFQVQSKGRTCQGEMEAALSKRFNRKVRVVGAGRTDAGVHARGQAFHFDLYSYEIRTKVDTDTNEQDSDANDDNTTKIQFCTELQRSMNSMLPQDIGVWNLSLAPSSKASVETEQPDGTISTNYYTWSALSSAKKKLYSYRLSLYNPSNSCITIDPIQRYTRVLVENDIINTEELERILKHYEGTHDFRAFAGAIEANQRKAGIEYKNTVRTIYSVNLVDEKQGNYRIDILLKGALYKMVRNMVGTALEVCKGRMEEEYMLRLLHQKGNKENRHQFVRKDNKCKPADPEGLTLEMVFFDDDCNF